MIIVNEENMNSLFIAQIEEVRQKMEGYTVLLGYRYMNLCVKAEAASLMPVTVIDEGTEYDIEELADVAVANNYQLVVYPKYHDLLNNIIAGIAEAHPEFKMSVRKGKMTYMTDEELDDFKEKRPGKESDNMDQFPEASLDGDLSGLFLLYTMPEVDKDRRDLLTTAVKSLHTECVMRIDSLYAHHADLFLSMLANTPAKEADSLKDALKRTHDEYKGQADKLRDEKLKEIDDAYAHYTLKQDKAKEEMSDFTKGFRMSQEY